jgi:hypothetical protein
MSPRYSRAACEAADPLRASSTARFISVRAALRAFSCDTVGLRSSFMGFKRMADARLGSEKGESNLTPETPQGS